VLKALSPACSTVGEVVDALRLDLVGGLLVTGGMLLKGILGSLSFLFFSVILGHEVMSMC
jgi:hypothetical protein